MIGANAGNKLRKLDGIASSWKEAGVSDVVTCGGVQSAHAAAIGATALQQRANDGCFAVVCAANGWRFLKSNRLTIVTVVVPFSAAVCAEQGIRAHLNLRGEAPEVPTGNTLIVRAAPHAESL